MMKKFEAPTLAEACAQASKELGCSIENLEYNIVQYPKKGMFGLFAKQAIIVAMKKIPKEEPKAEQIKNSEEKETNKSEVKEDIQEKSEEFNKIDEIAENKEDRSTATSTEIVDSFFAKSSSKKEYIPKTYKDTQKESIDAVTLENRIKELFSHSCFDIDTIEVDIEDNTAYIFIDGDDAALLIGKEGYRYNALSYLLFNWINPTYGLYLKLEIAQFLASQQDMIKHQMQQVIEHVNQHGWGKTRELNGILVQIALEHLRDVFPNKYVAIKKSQNGERYIVINDFNKR